MRCLIPALTAVLAALPVGAETPSLSLELNDTESVDGACRLTFLVENRLGADLGALGAEAVIFTTEGRVERLLSLDLQGVPAGRARVRQFDLPGLDCAKLGRVLINAVTPCDGEGLAPDACSKALVPTSRLGGVEVTG